MEIIDIETTLVKGDTGENARHHCFVHVRTDEGISGLGEATAPGMERATEMAVHDLSRVLVGRDPRNIEGLWDRAYNAYAWNWGPVSMTALSGIEMALWDVLGKHHDVRVCDLLGGPMTEKIDVYANGVIGGDSPADYGEAATEVVKRGYEMTKFVPFDQPEGDSAWPDDLSRDRGVERLRAVRDAVGDSLALGIDFHGVHAPQVAIELVERVTAFDPAFVEEPIPPENQAAMRRIRDRINVPIATGERLLTVFDYRDFLDDPTPGDIVQPDVSNCGGISQLKKIASMAYAEYVPIAPHNSRGPVATAAAAHACATIPNFLVLEYFPDLPPWRDDLIVGSEYVENGVYHLPDGPGLGIELNEDALDDHPYEKDNRTDEIFTCGFRGMR